MSPWSAIGSAMVQRVVRDAPRLSPRICAAFSAWSAMVRTKTQINEKWRGCRYYNPHSPDDVAILSALDTILI
jgi:hypothetical protein